MKLHKIKGVYIWINLKHFLLVISYNEGEKKARLKFKVYYCLKYHFKYKLTWKSQRLTFGTSILCVDGHKSSYFLLVKISSPTRWTWKEKTCLEINTVHIDS